MTVSAHALSRIPLLAKLPQATLERLAQVATARTYEPAQLILLAGEPCEAVYFVGEGHLPACRSLPSGRQQVLTELDSGGVFNLVPALQADGANHACVEAVTSATCYLVSKHDLRRLVGESRELALLILQDMAEKLDHLTNLVEDISLRSVRGRLALLSA
jgi:CRP/FNR family cyclic AMP-dependent transcriptional regulator